MRELNTPALSAGPAAMPGQGWEGLADSIAFDAAGVRRQLADLERPCFIVRAGGRVGLTAAGGPTYGQGPGGVELLGAMPPLSPEQLGDPAFRAAHGLRYAYMAGAMANGISSAELVVALGQAGMLGSFGAAGLVPDRVEEAIRRIQAALPAGPYAFNLIHSPSEEALERRAVELYLRHGVRAVEASAFLRLTSHIVRYRAAGLSLDAGRRGHGGQPGDRQDLAPRGGRAVSCARRPAALLGPLVEAGLITPLQAQLAAPGADGRRHHRRGRLGRAHRQPPAGLPAARRSWRCATRSRPSRATRQAVRVGAAGGIGTPAAALAAFMMGAAYVVTGSVNQACVESGASPARPPAAGRRPAWPT